MSKLPIDQRSASEASEATITGSIGTHSSTSLSNPDLARVFVRLNNGTKIVVPIPQNSTVHSLHVQTLRRATRLGFSGSLDDTMLQTIGNNPVVLFGEDPLIDVLDLTDDNTFSLGSLSNPEISTTATGGGNPRATPHSGTSSLQSEYSALADTSLSVDRKESKIYIRWITLESAMEDSRLRKIAADRSSIPPNTTLAAFHQIAVERLCSTTRIGACTKPTGLNLFLRDCRLHTKNNGATLLNLGLNGSKHEPLDIFVEFIGPEPRLSLRQLSPSTEPESLWSFDSTKRGISTFITSLQILLKEIGNGNCSLDGILEVLWEITHFPPLLLAFRSVHETGLDSGTPAGPLLLVASAFHALCSRMVPSKICPSTSTFLEASRQVLCWIFSIRSEASLVRGNNMQLVQRVQITEDKNNVELTPTFMPFNKVETPLGEGLDLKKKTFLVSTETGNAALCRRLGIAIHEKSASPWDFYFNAPEGWNTLWDHKIVPLLHSNEFDSLIETTNSIFAFRIVGPLQLGTCLAAELPVITLSSAGFVSRYDHEDLECSERSFITWNAVQGREKLPDNPGQFLSQKLEPILADRKKNPSWQLDAWPEWTKTADFGPPEEAIVICVDTSSSMRVEMPDGWIPHRNSLGMNPSRLTEVKEFFKNLALRISALNLATHLGLITFSNNNKVAMKQPLTALHLNFTHQLDNINASGSTAIFDALETASLNLSLLKHKYPQTKCRIILLTDGEDNDSTVVPSVVSNELYRNNIVLDAVVIGTSKTSDLFKVARHTGGYAFAPKTQRELFQIFLLETVVDIRTRPDIVRSSWSDWTSFEPKQADMANPYDFPPCRPHPNINDYFFALGDAERFMNRMSRRSAHSSASVHSASTRLSVASTMTIGAGGSSRMLLSEIKAAIDHAHDYMDIYVSQSNMGFWKVVMQGPPDSPYANGTFLLYIEIGPEFPRKPPSARFITPMLHPNITKHGRVCHPIFDREWTPATRVYQVLQQLYGILMSLEARDAVDPLSALRFWSDEQEGRREVENYVNRFARRSRALQHFDIIGDDLSSLASSSARSSYASSAASGSTAATPSSPPFDDRIPTISRNPFSDPPSYRSVPSLAASTVRSGTTGSTLASHLANQRRPQQAPPLMAGAENMQRQDDPRLASPAGLDGRNRLARTSTPSSSNLNARGSGRSQGEGEEGSISGGRRLSRRASFFARLRNIGS